MSRLPYQLRSVALLLMLVVVLLFFFAPQPLLDGLRGLANFWSLGLMAAAAGTLVWFLYWVFLRKLLRVRRIANIRLRRMLEDDSPDQGE
jgi:hypothetical protein